MPAFKQHIGLYPPISGDKSIEKATGRYAGPKGNLQFPLDEPMPYSLLERIVKLQVKEDNEKAAKRKKGKQVRGQIDAIPGRLVLINLPRRPCLKQTGLYIYAMTKTQPKKSDARQRIVETAERLFYAEGMRAVGIDRIIAEAKVAKMSLYNHFPSKDDLILAVLQYREQKFDGIFEKWMDRHVRKGKDRLEAFFAALKDWLQSPGFRGCMFINSCVEFADVKHPASKFSAEHKERFRALITSIILETAGDRAVSLAPAISLLVEGAIVTAVMEQSSAPADVAKDAALALLPKEKRR